MDRREFLVKGLPREMAKLFVQLQEAEKSFDLGEKKEGSSSPVDGYSIIMGFPTEELIKAAKQLGIEVGRKDRLQLAKEIVSHYGPPPRAKEEGSSE